MRNSFAIEGCSNFFWVSTCLTDWFCFYWIEGCSNFFWVSTIADCLPPDISVQYNIVKSKIQAGKGYILFFWNTRAINWYSKEKTEFDEEFIHIDGGEWRIFLPPGSIRIFEFSDIFLIDSPQYSSCLLIRKSNLFLMRSNIILSWKMKNK